MNEELPGSEPSAARAASPINSHAPHTVFRSELTSRCLAHNHCNKATTSSTSSPVLYGWIEGSLKEESPLRSKAPGAPLALAAG